MLRDVDVTESELEKRLVAARDPGERAALLGIDLAAVTGTARLLLALTITITVVLTLAILIATGIAALAAGSTSIAARLVLGLVGGAIGYFASLIVAGIATSRIQTVWIRIVVVASGSAVQILVFALVSRLGDASLAVLGGLLLSAVIVAGSTMLGPSSMRRALSSKRLNPKSLITLRNSPGWTWGEHGKIGGIAVVGATTLISLGVESVLVVVNPVLIPLALVLSVILSALIVLWSDTPRRYFPLLFAYPVILVGAILLTT